MSYGIISMVVVIYFGESISSRVLTTKLSLIILGPSVGVCLAVFFCNLAVTSIIPDEKVNNTINICCSDISNSNKCDFMEKYGCESFNITRSQFNKVDYSEILTNLIAIYFIMSVPV